MTGAAIKLIVAADEPALLFRSIESAELALEWIDVRDGVYSAAYDPDGNVYRLRYEGQKVIIERDGNRCEPAALNALLRQKIAAAYMPINSDDNAFLLSLCANYIERH